MGVGAWVVVGYMICKIIVRELVEASRNVQ